MVGQLYSFIAEFGYLVATAFIRFIGRGIYGIDVIELVNCLRIMEFGVLSSVQVSDRGHKWRMGTLWIARSLPTQ